MLFQFPQFRFSFLPFLVLLAVDATRYLVMSGVQVACREPREEEIDNRQWIDSTRNEYTGY